MTSMFKPRLGNNYISELIELSTCICALIESFYLFNVLFLVFLFFGCFLFIGSSLEVLNP